MGWARAAAQRRGLDEIPKWRPKPGAVWGGESHLKLGLTDRRDGQEDFEERFVDLEGNNLKKRSKERGDLPGDIACVGDTIRFPHGKRSFRGKVVSVTEMAVTAKTKSGRLYGVFRSDVQEIEKLEL